MIPQIVIIGAGKLAASLASALYNENIKIAAVISRSPDSASSLAEQYNIPVTGTAYTLIPEGESIVFLTVPESGIARAAADAASPGRDFTGTVFVHTSGAEGIQVLSPLTSLGASSASMHIMQTFPSRYPVPLTGCYSAIETEDENCFELLSRLAVKLGMKPFRLPSEGKIFYHLTAVYVSNFLVSAFTASKMLFDKTGIEGINFIDLIKPLAERSVSNISSVQLPVDALSGPIDRGELKTVKNHIQALTKSEDSAFLLNDYVCNSLILLDALEKRDGMLKEGQKEIKEFLLDLLSKTTEKMR